jgi:hypothetical protein
MWIDDVKLEQGGIREFFVRPQERRRIVFLDKAPYVFTGHIVRLGDRTFKTLKCIGESCLLCREKVSLPTNMAFATIYDVTVDNSPLKKLYVMRSATLRAFAAVCRDIMMRDKTFNPENLAMREFVVVRASQEEPGSGGSVVYTGLYKGTFSDTQVYDYSSLLNVDGKQIWVYVNQAKEYKSSKQNVRQ